MPVDLTKLKESKIFDCQERYLELTPSVGDTVNKWLITSAWVNKSNRYIKGYKLECPECGKILQFVGVRTVRESNVRYCDHRRGEFPKTAKNLFGSRFEDIVL